MNVKLWFSRTAQKVLWSLSKTLCCKIQFFKNRGYFPDFKHPQDISEIVLSEIITGKVREYAPFVDKIEVRKYIDEWGLGQYLPKLYGIWNSVEEVDFDSLPDSFALKTNHGCGSHYLCPNKKDLDIVEAKRRISAALNTRYGLIEQQYDCIPPKCFAEEYIADIRGGGQPLDYKFMCCDGEVRCVLICSERDTGTRLATYSLAWEKLDYIRDFEKSTKDFEKPKNFDEMCRIAKLIAKKFLYVRVDLYSLPSGKIYIGELTFTPEGGIMLYFKNSAVKALGHLR